MKRVTWKNGFYKRPIFSEGKRVGSLEAKEMLSSFIIAQLNDTKLLFKVKTFSLTIEILDPNNFSIIGMIKRSTFSSSAQIFLNNKVYKCESTDFLSAKWSVFDENRICVSLSDSFMKREGNYEDEALFLIGLFLAKRSHRETYFSLIGFLVPVLGAIHASLHIF